MKAIKYLRWAALCAIGLWGCSGDSINTTGGGSGTETTGIVGTAITAEGAFVVNASVYLRRADFLDTIPSAFGKKSVYLADGTTDDSGHYSFTSIDSGCYFIEITDGNGNAATQACTISTTDSLYDLGHSMLLPMGTIFGSVGDGNAADSARFTICVYGLDGRTTTSNYSGEFSINDIPQGTYTISIIPDIGIYERYDTANISVNAGMSSVIGTVPVPKPAISIHPDDSTILRAILDSNGINGLSEITVTTSADWPFRIIGLSINNGALTTLTPHIGRLVELRTLDVSGNGLTSLPPDLQNLVHLQTLVVRNNLIEALPYEIGNLDSLIRLDIAYNRLTSMASNIGRLRSIAVIDASHNLIAAIPPDVAMSRSLRVLMMTGNLLTALPPEISNATALQDLRVDSNAISILPQQITMLRPPFPFINITGNKLCGVIPIDIASWLDMYSTDFSGWRTTQQCP